MPHASEQRAIAVFLGIGVATLNPGCLPTERAGFDAASPSRRLDAIIQAAGPRSDPATLARLVEQLDSQDAAARMLAIRALEARTGTTMGYTHTDPEWKRQEAIDRWISSLEKGGSVPDTVAEPSPSAGGNAQSAPMNP
ncbi:MAG: hypothetical protein AAGA55_12355 [Planctomycetota bacterium]